MICWCCHYATSCAMLNINLVTTWQDMLSRWFIEWILPLTNPTQKKNAVFQLVVSFSSSLNWKMEKKLIVISDLICSFEKKMVWQGWWIKEANAFTANKLKLFSKKRASQKKLIYFGEFVRKLLLIRFVTSVKISTVSERVYRFSLVSSLL